MRYVLKCLLTCMCFCLTACSSYQLGNPEAASHFSSIHVNVIGNESYAPQVRALLLKETIEQFLREGSLKIKDSKTADASLDIVLTDYNRKGGAITEKDTGIYATSTLTLEAEISLSDNRDGRVYIQKKKLEAKSRIFPQENNTGTPDSERHAMTTLSRDLGKKIFNLVTGQWQ